MTAKEFQFLVLNTKADWERGRLHNLTADDGGIQLRSGLQFVAEHKLNRFEVVDLAVGDLGQVYWLDGKNRQIVLFDSQQNYSESIDFLQDLFDRPTNIAYSPSTIYVADESKPLYQTRIYALAHRLNWQIRREFTLPVGIKAIDLVADRDGTLYVLLNIGEQLIAKYDSSGQLIATTGFVRGDLTEPQAIAIAPDGHICVLTAEAIVKFKPDGSPAETHARLYLEELIPKSMSPAGLAIDGEGNFYFGDRCPSLVGEEEERFIFCLSPSGDTAQPVTGYRGAAEKLVLDRTNRLVIFNPERQEINILRGEKRFLRRQFPKLPTGKFYSQALDSTNSGQRWHKIVLDAEIPANTQIKVYYAISDDLNSDLGKAEALRDRQWSESIINPTDALIRGTAGRYLYLKVELIGSDRATPTLKSLRVEFPRRSYLRYLPAVYQEDEASRDFLERFLSIFETSLSKVERQIDQIVRYFDAEVVSPEFLPWLASWLAIAVDDNWTEKQLRQLIQKAPQLYQQRGTREGIAATVEIFTGSRPLVVEPFQVTHSELNKLYGNNPFRFWVLLDTAHIQKEIELQTLQRLIEAETPAHTEACLRVLSPSIALDRESYLGFNSRVFDPALRLDRGAAISQDSILTDPEEYGQLGRRSRLSLDTILN